LYSLNYIILSTALSCPNSRMLKFTVTLYPSILTYMGPVSRLIILSLYSTGSSKIIINEYRYSFPLYSIPNYSTTSSIMWFLITPLFIITLNCLSCHLTFKSKFLPIVSLRVWGLSTSSLISNRPDLFPTVNLPLANI
jgi:hypothetical protein